jgi:large subunit ribosomal protein L18
MINKIDKNEIRKKRSLRVREKVKGTIERPRLNVYRSLNNIFVQIIDDVNGHTLASASTISKDVASSIANKTKSEAAFIVGQTIAKNAISKGIKRVVFDRAGYIYTGRVKAVAEGARNGGLEF